MKAKMSAPKKVVPLPKLLAKAQIVFNAWIRIRDQNAGCISCGGEVQQAGHYYSQGHHSALRFDERNVHGQTVRCNCFLHGNLINYRKGLVKRYGEKYVLDLEKDAETNPIKKWSRIELEEILNKYKS